VAGDAAGARNRPLPDPKAYIVMAALTFGRWEPGTFILPEILGEAGLVMMNSKTSHTSRVPVPIVFPFSSCNA